MNKKVSLGVTISVAAMTAAITFIVTLFFSLQQFNSQVQAVKEKAAKYDRLESVDTYVRSNFYLPLDDDAEEKLMDGILKGYVSGLDDPYSHYLTSEEYREMMEKESGKQVGIGVTASYTEENLIEIMEVEEGSPAETAGIQVGDFITHVDSDDVTEMGFEEAVGRIRGDENTEVRLNILRDGEEKKFIIVRKSFDLKTVKGQLFDGRIGYIRITNFRENTAEQFQEKLEELTANGAEALVFDVRNNSGGLLSALQQMLDPLLPEGVIATATYQDGTTNTIVYSDASELNLPMVVLVNGSSASAAELFAASLHDFGKATLVGEKTFGKGIMQNTIRMNDGGGLTLTTATYQVEGSECYHGVGIEPDVKIEAGEYTGTGDPDPETDPQLSTALELLN